MKPKNFEIQTIQDLRFETIQITFLRLVQITVEYAETVPIYYNKRICAIAD